MRSEAEHLQRCPTCGSDVTSDLGLRDYSTWLLDRLPDRVGATDVDLVLEQDATDRLLVMEFKRPGEYLGLGQRLTLEWFVRHGADVWLVHEGNDTVSVAPLDANGETYVEQAVRPGRLGRLARKWWDAGL